MKLERWGIASEHASREQYSRSMISYTEEEHTMDQNDIETAKKLIAKANAAWIIAPKENVEPIDIYAMIATALGEAREQGRQEAAGKAKAKKGAE